MSPIFLFLFLLLPRSQCQSGDMDALLALKAAVDTTNALPWQHQTAAEMCTTWIGVKECSSAGRVTKLILESVNLTGTLTTANLAPLDQLRVLSLKSNYFSGPIPDLTPITTLKSLYLGNNRFTGRIPSSLSSLHRLKVIALENNRLTGPIPPTFTTILRLHTLLLENNRLTGPIPPFTQPGLRIFNVSGNELSGKVPHTPALAQFDPAAFHGNKKLCGAQLRHPCPSGSPEFPPTTPIDLDAPPPPSTRRKRKRLIPIIAGMAAGGMFLLLFLLLLFLLLYKRNPRVDSNKPRSIVDRSAGGGGGEEVSWSGGTATEDGKGTYKWESEEGRLEFCGGAGKMFGLEELLRASAEMLGRGTVGSTYKAVMETGYIVTVKRLVEAAETPLEAAEFGRRMEEMGRLRHTNLVPLRAYFQAKEERLLVYEYFPNGSLFSLIHGSRPSGSGKPLHWTSCLKIAEDVAAGLLYLHNSGTVHGNLKSSNVLLGPDFESCLTDYALFPYLHSGGGDTAATALLHRAPESRHPRKLIFTPPSDIYSFGVLLLKLLTGKTPFQDLVERHGVDIPRWVRSVREECAESSGDDPVSEEKMGSLLVIAMACVAVVAERRPTANDVLRMVREARAEAIVSSNSSDHSPVRWAETMQGLPRDHFVSESFESEGTSI